MRRRFWLLAALALISTCCIAEVNQSRLNVKTNDGSVNTYPYQAKFSNGSVTDNGDGTVSIAISTGSSSSGPTLTSTQTWSGRNTWTTPSVSNFTYGLSVGTITTRGLGNVISETGISSNTAGSLLSVFKANSHPGELLFTVGSNQQADLFMIKDSQAIDFQAFGIRAGDVRIGTASNFNRVLSVQEGDQYVDLWNAGELQIQTTVNSGKDIVFKPRAVTKVRISPTTGMTVLSSMTITGAGLNVPMVILTSTTTFSILPSSPDGAMLYCTDCTTTTPASCNAASLASCVCTGSGSGAMARRINGNWYCH